MSRQMRRWSHRVKQTQWFWVVVVVFVACTTATAPEVKTPSSGSSLVDKDASPLQTEKTLDLGAFSSLKGQENIQIFEGHLHNEEGQRMLAFVEGAEGPVSASADQPLLRFEPLKDAPCQAALPIASAEEPRAWWIAIDAEGSVALELGFDLSPSFWWYDEQQQCFRHQALLLPELCGKEEEEQGTKLVTLSFGFSEMWDGEGPAHIPEPERIRLPITQTGADQPGHLEVEVKASVDGMTVTRVGAENPGDVFEEDVYVDIEEGWLSLTQGEDGVIVLSIDIEIISSMSGYDEQGFSGKLWIWSSEDQRFYNVAKNKSWNLLLEHEGGTSDEEGEAKGCLISTSARKRSIGLRYEGEILSEKSHDYAWMCDSPGFGDTPVRGEMDEMPGEGWCTIACERPGQSVTRRADWGVAQGDEIISKLVTLERIQATIGEVEDKKCADVEW